MKRLLSCHVGSWPFCNCVIPPLKMMPLSGVMLKTYAPCQVGWYEYQDVEFCGCAVTSTGITRRLSVLSKRTALWSLMAGELVPGPPIRYLLVSIGLFGSVTLKREIFRPVNWTAFSQATSAPDWPIPMRCVSSYGCR